MYATSIGKNKRTHSCEPSPPPSEWGGPFEGRGMTLNKPEKSLLANRAVGNDGPGITRVEPIARPRVNRSEQ